mmetsp:Transcript_25401/g.30110  ORF Transcript_25401/g.30110 Transcript_25401/m.30110 type:complete len:580 (+) Transcript_25401:53-1792(+)
MGVVSAAKGAYESNAGQIIITVFTVGSALFSLISAIIALTAFEAATDNLTAVIGNWERSPVTGIYLSSSETCPTGYSLMDDPKWPGTYSSACACPTDAFSTIEGSLQYSSASATCDANQTDGGCFSQATLSSVSLKEWRGMYICLKREGEAQLLSSSKTRPIPKKNGVCQSGYQACGTGTYDNARTICFPDTYDCPVSGVTTATSLPDGYESTNAMSTDDSNIWYSRNSYMDEMPINHIELVLYKPNGKVGQCFLGGGNHESYDGDTNGYTYANNYPTKCSKLDTRWETLDYQTETDYLGENFENEDSCLTDTVTADYIATGTQCSSTPLTSTDCMMYGVGSSFAGCNDDICRNIMYQSKCGGLTRVSTQNDYYWAVQYRREIYWKSDCQVSMTDIKGIEKPVEEVYPALQTNLAFNVIGNFFVGMFFPICLLLNKFYGDVPCIPGEGETEKNLIEWNKKYLNVTLSAFKLVPAIIAIAFFGKITSVIRGAANGDCADSDDNRTTLTFEELDFEISESIRSLWTQVGVDIFNIVVAIVLTIFAHMKKSKTSKVSPDEEGGGGGEEEKGQVEMVEGTMVE